MIVIKDIGYVKKTDAETHELFEFIAHRYESASLSMTANQPFCQWDQVFLDSRVTVAATRSLDSPPVALGAGAPSIGIRRLIVLRILASLSTIQVIDERAIPNIARL